MTTLVGPLLTLLLLLWRFAVARIALVTLWALLIAFGWLMERNVEGWHETTPVNYVVQGFVALSLFLLPPALVLGFSSPSRSWQWGLLLTWPLLVLSVMFVGSGCVIDTITCVPFEFAPTLAGILLPVLLVPATCLAAWIAATGREAVGVVFARSAPDPVRSSQDRRRPDVPLFGGRPISDQYFAGPVVRRARQLGRRVRRGRDGSS